MHTDPLWTSDQAQAAVARHDPGALIRLGRTSLRWRQADLAVRLGCSASTVSRLETRHHTDLTLLHQAARAVGMPTHVLAGALGLAAPGARTTVAADGPHRAEEDDLRRRTLLAAAALAGSAPLLAGIDQALAVPPDPTGTPVPLDAQLAAARAYFDAGQHEKLLAALPGLLGNLHAGARRHRDPLAYARLSAGYGLASEILSKTAAYGRARLTADRAVTYAELSGSPLASAAAARELSIVLRHLGQPQEAQRLVLGALSAIEATGLATGPQQAAYAQMLCTTAYTAARGGDRDTAHTMINDAVRAARDLPARPPAGRLFRVTPAAVTLYRVGVDWALGDAGAALEAGRSLHPGQFPTADRRARMHTDLARAWWLRQRPEQTATELLAAVRVSRAEVRDRPAIRSLVKDLAQRHPQTPGVRALAAATGIRP